MAIVRGNVILNGVSGSIGRQVVVRSLSNGRVAIGVPPRRAKGAKPTPAQEAHQERFRKAILYGKISKGKLEYGPIAASRGVSTFNVATADFMHTPEVESVDLTSYTGGM